MADEPLEATQEPVQPVVEPTVQPTATGEKTFKQSELDTIIKTRLREQKSTHDTALAAVKGELETANQLVEKYSKIIQKSVEKQIEKLPASMKELVSMLDLADQLEWLDKHAGDYLQKQGVPPVPDGKQPEKLDLVEKKRRSGNYGKSI